MRVDVGWFPFSSNSYKKLQSELFKSPQSSFLDILTLQLPVAQKTQVLHHALRALWVSSGKVDSYPKCHVFKF